MLCLCDLNLHSESSEFLDDADKPGTVEGNVSKMTDLLSRLRLVGILDEGIHD